MKLSSSLDAVCMSFITATFFLLLVRFLVGKTLLFLAYFAISSSSSLGPAGYYVLLSSSPPSSGGLHDWHLPTKQEAALNEVISFLFSSSGATTQTLNTELLSQFPLQLKHEQ